MDPRETHGLWAGLHAPGSSPDETTFSILGIPYDGGVCARTGAALGPERVRYWSHHITPFNESRIPLDSLSICDLGDIEIQDPSQDFDKVREKVASLTNIPVLLGGDHSVTIPIFHGQRQRFAGKRLGVLWVDAHPDLCDIFTGSKLSHACTLRRGLEIGIQEKDICLVGVRSWEHQEIEYIANSHLNIYTAANVAEHGMRYVATQVRDVLANCDQVHISLDIDSLDPAFAPGTGIPDAGGMSTREVLTLIQSMRGLPIAGLDLVEVAPPLDPSEATVFAALKIIMEFIALFANQTSA